jgi:aryl-alcohol dehydrogenase-like predicted oxidoreductase
MRISPLTFGTITFGGDNGMEAFGHVDRDTARQMFDLALDRGVNMIDTANMYSLGLAEEITGEALDVPRYDDLMVTSKVRMVVGDGPNDGGQSRVHILEEVEKSVRRLRRDHIDLYYLHEWDGQTPLEETLQTMDGLVRSGKIRYYGVSNYTAWQLMKVLMICERHNFIKPVGQQIYYTPQAREAEYEMIPASIDQGLANQIWSPLAMGSLTGKYHRNNPEVEDARQTELGWTGARVADRENLYDMVDVLSEIASGKGVTIPQVVLSWVMDRPFVSSVVVGARTVEQWRDSLGALDVTLTDDEMKRIEAVRPPPMMYPFWHQSDLASDRLSAADEDIISTMERAHLGS